MRKTKLTSMQALAKTKGYILVTDSDTYVDIDYNSLEGMLAIQALRRVRSELDTIIKEWEKEL